MKYAFALVTIGIVAVLLSSTSVFSSTPENNTVLQQAQKALQKKVAIVSPEPNPSAFQLFHGTSKVQQVFFTWVIITSGNELSVNLRYGGDGTSPPVIVTATAISKNIAGKPVTMKGSADLNAGWISPFTVEIPMNGESSLYASTSINVVASPSGSSPSPLPSTAAESTDNKISSLVKPQEGVLKVLSSNSFIDKIGYLHLVGEIENGTPNPISYVKATATFYDKMNNVVATDFAFTSPSDLGPGDKAPFEIIVTSASVPINQIDHNSIIASQRLKG